MKIKKTEQAGTSHILALSAAAGVSTATVSRVFSRHPYVSEEIRERVLRLAREMNYAPHISSSRYIFGILIGNTTGFDFGAYANQLLYYSSKKLFEEGFNAQIFTPLQLPYLHKNTFRGILMTGNEHAAKIRELGIPSVAVNVFADGIHSVLTDHRAGLELAVNHLVKNGHRKIAFLRCKSNTWGSNERENGYQAAMKANRISADPRLTGVYETHENIVEAISLLLKENPTALIVEGEDNCTVVNYALYLLNKKVPDDLSLITFEDHVNSRYMTPPQTTISQDFAELGRVAVETLVAVSSGKKCAEKIPKITILRCNKLVERLSVKKI